MNSLVEICNKLIADNPDKVQQARKKPELAGWFVGQVLRRTTAYSKYDIGYCLARRGIGSLAQ